MDRWKKPIHRGEGGKPSNGEVPGAGTIAEAAGNCRAGLDGAAGTISRPLRQALRLSLPQFPTSGVSPACWAGAAAQAARSDDVAGKALEPRRRLSEPWCPSSVSRELQVALLSPQGLTGCKASGQRCSAHHSCPNAYCWQDGVCIPGTSLPGQPPSSCPPLLRASPTGWLRSWAPGP